jgi:hypothetical protein
VVPFALANIAAFSLTVYGMAGLNRDPTAVVVHVALSLLLYLNATQVGPSCMACCDTLVHPAAAAVRL